MPPSARRSARARALVRRRAATQVRPVLEAILLHPAAPHGPAHGQAAGRVRRRPAARAAAARSTPRPGGGSAQTRRPAALPPARTWPAGTTSAGSTRAPCAAAGLIVDDGPPRPLHPGTRRRRVRRHRDARAGRGRGARVLGRPALTRRDARRRSPASPPAALHGRHGRAGSSTSTARAPERAPPAHRCSPDLQVLMTPWPRCSCNDFSRAAAAAQPPPPRPAQGLPAIEPGMPMPAGTGLTRRAFVSRAARARARRLRRRARSAPTAFEEGIAAAAAAAPAEPRARVGLPRRRRRRADASSRPTGRPALRARCARRSRCRAGAGTAFAEDTEPALAPVGRAGSRRSTARARSPCCPAIGYTRPEPVALHEPPLLGGRRARRRAARCGWLGRYLDRHGAADNPLQGLTLGLARSRPRWRPAACRWPPSPQPDRLRLLGAGRLGPGRAGRCSTPSARFGELADERRRPRARARGRGRRRHAARAARAVPGGYRPPPA